jgi:DNA-binding transcriptional LysR family regulator
VRFYRRNAIRFDWDDLRYFLAVAHQRTVSSASRRLGVDHATVIRRIDALEQALSAKLFERTPRGYGLTQSGLQLMESAERIGHEAERVQSEIGDRSDLTGTVRISTLEGFGNFFLARRLPTFAAAYPRLRIELLTIQQIVALSHREADIAITVNPPEVTRFERIPLVDYTLLVYGSRDYLAAGPKIACRDDLLKHRFSGYIDDLVFTRGLDYLSEIVPGLRPSLHSSSVHAQLEFVCAGSGLCVLPSFVARSRPDLVPILPDQVSLQRTYWLVKPLPKEAALGVHLASDFITKAAEQERNIFLPAEH